MKKVFEEMMEKVFDKTEEFCGRASNFVDNIVENSAVKLESVKEIAAVAVELEETRQAEKFAFEQLGRKLYEYRVEAPKTFSFAPYEKELRDVAEIIKRRNYLEEWVLEAKGMEKCPDCGKEVPAGTKFCPDCGKSFYDTEDEVPDDNGFCTNCGAPISDDQKFCGKCGTRL